MPRGPRVARMARLRSRACSGTAAGRATSAHYAIGTEHQGVAGHRAPDFFRVGRAAPSPWLLGGAAGAEREQRCDEQDVLDDNPPVVAQLRDVIVVRRARQVHEFSHAVTVVRRRRRVEGARAASCECNKWRSKNRSQRGQSPSLPVAQRCRVRSEPELPRQAQQEEGGEARAGCKMEDADAHPGRAFFAAFLAIATSAARAPAASRTGGSKSKRSTTSPARTSKPSQSMPTMVAAAVSRP
jgi:hypothetical protein